ncbi:MAG: hypothetical protein KGJ86_14320 [Chloroflexota bacterium]|nr:hypothetical protein [Chloroflexota bacterium]
MKRSLIALMLAALFPVSASFAQTAAAPVISGPASGTLAGGAEADYQLPIPGQNLSAIVTMQFSPGDASGAVGFSLVGSQGEIPAVTQCLEPGTQVPPSDVTVTPAGASAPVRLLGPATPFCFSGPSTLSAGVTQTAPETYIVKVFNRRMGVPITYSLSVSGIPLTCQPATATGGPTPPQASVLGQPVTAQLGGGAQGQFTYYRFHYAGDGSTVMLTMFYNPVTFNTRGGPAGFNPGLGLTNPNTGAVGFNVYLGSDTIKQGERTAGDGQLVTGFNSGIPGDYYVQVFNYTNPALTINYTLSLSGLPCPTTAATTALTPTPQPSAADGRTSDTPLAFSGRDSRALGGNPIGSFVWYRFVYDGHSQPNLSMSFTPADPVQSAASGFNVYGPNGLSLQSGLTGQGPGAIGLTLPSSAPAGAYYVQVFNYIAGSTISFTLQRG